MRHIVVDFQPFSVMQNILVYANGECIRQIVSPLDDVVVQVAALQKRYNIEQIDLCGATQYIKLFQEKMMTEFRNDNVKINIVRR